ncbi:MAG: aldehyde dehydrogenase [Thermoleophilaceae bacterium]|nr:aldehyde dehydrogenase [Thermoleophilaceae bacterium]
MATILDDPSIAVLPAVREFAAGIKPLFIDGEFVEAASGETFDTIDASTGEVITQISAAGEEDIDRAVTAAARAFETWGKSHPAERERLLFRLADLIEENAEELAQLESLDGGKPVGDAAAVDIPLTAATFRYNGGWPSKIEGITIPTAHDAHVYTRREPVGVVGAIVAWNFPLLLAAWKLGPALAAGCTVVLKPAEQTPLSTLRLAELIAEAGFPPGVVNVCNGLGETAGRAIVRHPGIRKIAFTGSLEVGRQIARESGDTLKHVTLELGGKSPNIVFADADVATAAAAAASAIFFNTGQVCTAGSRLLVERSIHDEVIELVVAEGGKMKMGPGLAADTTLGPLVSQAQFERVTGYIDMGEREGASVVTGGKAPEGNGYFLPPTVLADAPDELTVVREEIFGPVVVVQPFESIEEVARRANANSYGLAAGVWTNDLQKAHKVAEHLQAGTVWINTYNALDPAVGVGGVKDSGYGKDNGREGLEKYLQTKTVWTAFH